MPPSSWPRAFLPPGTVAPSRSVRSRPTGERGRTAVTLARLARWCYRNRRRVVVLWIAAFVIMNVLGGAFGDAYSNNFSGGKSASISAFDLLKERFPSRAGDTADIVFRADQSVNDPGVRSRMAALFAAV